MLSFKRTDVDSIPIARAKAFSRGRVTFDKILYVDPNYNSHALDSKYEEDSEDDEESSEDADYLSEDDYRYEDGREFSAEDEFDVLDKLRRGGRPIKAKLRMPYKRIVQKIADRKGKFVKFEEGVLFPVPPNDCERIFIAGRTGCGKSTWAANYIREYIEKYPKNDRWMFSRHGKGKDGAYSRLGLKWVKTEVFEEDEKPYDLKDLENSVVVFDDMDNHPVEKIKKATIALACDLFSNGRKYNITPIWICHVIAAGSSTKVIRSDANKGVIFKNGGEQTKKWLQTTASLDRQQIARIAKSTSRWTCVNVTSPAYVLTEHEAYLV